MNDAAWTTAAVMVGVLAPLAGVPLTVLTFYFRSMREQQLLRLADLDRRLEAASAATRRLRDELAGLRRDSATKEEWLRESIWARAEIERLAVGLARVETGLESATAARRASCGLAAAAAVPAPSIERQR